MKFILTKLAHVTNAEYKEEIEALEVSDGYHTMHELYQHRRALNVVLFNYIAYHEPDKVMKSLLHSDGTMFDGYFAVMMIIECVTRGELYAPDSIKIQQISYHYKLKHWDEFKIPEVGRLPPYDGHTSQDTLNRLLEYGQTL